MNKPRILAGVVLFLAAIAGLLLWQQRVIRSLESENAGLRQAALELQSVREENARLAQGRIDPAELERLRAGQSELIRLRGQVAQLRRQVAESANKRPAAAPETPPATAAEPSAPPVETYSATAHAVVGWKQTLVTGGWILPSGKRALVLIQPHLVEGDQVGQVELQTRIIEMPDSGFAQFGLDGMKTDNKLSSYSGLLTVEQTEAIIKALENMEGVDVISAPKILTADGREAQVKMVDVKTAPSGEKYEVGPSIDLVPKISSDGKSVELTVSAQLNLPSSPAK